MCFHKSLTKKQEEFKERFDAAMKELDVYEPYFHRSGFEDNYIYIIKANEPYDIVPSYWGIMPENYNIYQRKGFLTKTNTLNARSENLFTSPLFKEHIKTQRCLILADGFFEPHTRNKISYPHYIKYRDSNLFAFAGIYSELDDGLYTASIITTIANDFMKGIHNKPSRQGDYRMPLILDKSNEDDWLNGNLSIDSIRELLFTFTSNDLVSYPVTKNVMNSNVNSNIIKSLEPVHYDALNTLF
ncbi:SOS response-associated peptidase [Lacinutrix sp. 5H-3-7-4]|uniref:SOS response-associated peptidase n=1 Tax=Lacinutrix sp. (strain 5H-3-7-4) TaxID=983544 RepID=UPI00020A38E6|nr:SOS response-associated peptidase [Lacinutrix sp. 5H-3-7-4]AEH02130.1 protein of unknown function DUF159 [Lacinutrix sp. 5H-3-7-4]